MNKPQIRIAALFSFVLLIISSSCTKSVIISVELPAQVSVGGSLKSLGLVNRTLPQNKKTSILEGILSGEGLNQDERGGFKLLTGIQNSLAQSNRFSIKNTGLFMKGSTGIGFSMPQALSWKEVEDICKAQQVDGLIVLEAYDSNTQLLPSSKMITKTINNVSTQVPQFIVDLNVVIKAGIRIYNPKDRTIRDEYIQEMPFGWHSSGNTALEAMNAIMDKSRATDQASENFGYQYAQRIIPRYSTVTRVYFKKGGDERLKTAWRKSQVQNWESAGQLYEEIIKTSSSNKAKGRATHNLAVVREIYNELEQAKTLAGQAYSDYGVRQSRDYSNQLNTRIYNDQKLKEQQK